MIAANDKASFCDTMTELYKSMYFSVNLDSQ